MRKSAKLFSILLATATCSTVVAQTRAAVVEGSGRGSGARLGLVRRMAEPEMAPATSNASARAAASSSNNSSSAETAIAAPATIPSLAAATPAGTEVASSSETATQPETSRQAADAAAAMGAEGIATGVPVTALAGSEMGTKAVAAVAPAVADAPLKPEVVVSTADVADAPEQHRWDVPPARYTADWEIQAYHDGINAAKDDIANGRKADVGRQESYKHPTVNKDSHDTYRAVFNRAYDIAFQHSKYQSDQYPDVAPVGVQASK